MTSQPKLNIVGAADLIKHVPYEIGFQPHDDIVLIGLRLEPEGFRLSVTGRISAADTDDDMLARTARTYTHNGITAVVVLGYGLPDAKVLNAATVMRQLDLEVHAVLGVDGNHWRDLLCTDPTCCDPEGYELDDTVSESIAHAVASGRSPHASLEELAKEFERHPSNEVELHMAKIKDPGQLKPVFEMAVLAAAKVIDESVRTELPPMGVSATLLTALSDIEIRDTMWLAVDSMQVDGRRLWAHLASIAPGDAYCAPALLLAWANWRHGDHLRTRLVVEALLEQKPNYRPALLLVATLEAGVNPSSLPPLFKELIIE